MMYENDREDYELMQKLRSVEARRWGEMEERVYYERLEAKAKEDLKKVQEYKDRIGRNVKKVAIEYDQYKRENLNPAFSVQDITGFNREDWTEKVKARLEKGAMTDKMKIDGFIVKRDPKAIFPLRFEASKNGISIFWCDIIGLFNKIYGTKEFKDDLKPIKKYEK